jgi:EcsC protein family
MLAQGRSPFEYACTQVSTRLINSNSSLAEETLADETMADEKQSWMRRRVEGAIRNGLSRAYDTIKVDPGRFLMQLRVAHGLPLGTFHGVYTLPVERLDEVAESVIRGGMKLAAAEGAGLGVGGILTIVPDLGILSAITMRTIQKLSLIYGFELNTDNEIAELWIAAASAAGVDISRELLEKEVVNRFVPRVIQRIAVRAGAEVAEKWAGRFIPFLSSAIGCGLNYYFVRAWGDRARSHFRNKHLEARSRLVAEQEQLPSVASRTLPS